MILGKMCIDLGRAGIAVVQDLSNEMEAASTLSQPGTDSTPKIMEADVLDTRGLSYPPPGLINVHQMRTGLHSANHMGVVLLSWDFRQQVNDRL